MELSSALPANKASARIAVPASILGAVIIEWSNTGVGMEIVIPVGVYNAGYAVLWTVAEVFTPVLMGVYKMIVFGGRAVLRRYAPEQLA